MSFGAQQRYELLERFRTAEQGERIDAECGCEFFITGRGPQQIIWCPDHPPHGSKRREDGPALHRSEEP